MVGNRVFGHTLILCMAFALLLTPWGSLPQDDPTIYPAFDSLTGSASLHSASLRPDNKDDASQLRAVSGWNGNVALGKVMIPYWSIIACLAMGSLVSSLNWLRFTQLSSVVTFALFGMVAACSLVAIIHFAVHGEVGTGAVLAMTCALAGLAMSPTDGPVSQPVIHQFDAQSQARKAA